MNPALFFVPDGFLLEGHQIMGRRAAGAAFLRAMVAGREEGPLVGYGHGKTTPDIFARVVAGLDPAATTQWIPAAQTNLIAPAGTLHRADPMIAPEARLRLRSGPASYSITGVTHTLLSSGTLEAIGALFHEPVMPWDALICTSSAALSVVRSTLEAAAEQFRWRTGFTGEPTMPQLPVIPLGVHAEDWTSSDSARQSARARLGLAEDEVAILFAGRLSYAAKAHPFQMYEALGRVAEASGRPMALLLAGQFFNDGIERDFRSAAARLCPTVRLIHVDGADADLYAGAYAGADIFLSLADNLQETFGITPLEAMAAGLPSIVSDWNGYRDTVRDGIDGFRITSWAPAPGSCDRLGQAYEVDRDYDVHSSLTSTLVSVDRAELVERLTLLVGDAELRRRMGAAARERALSEFDWAPVYQRYRQLWAELGAIRRVGQRDRNWMGAAPKAHYAHHDPFRRFAGYPTQEIGLDTIIRAAPGADRAAYQGLVAMPMLSFWQIRPELAEAIFAACAEPTTIAAVAQKIGRDPNLTLEFVARLVKMNLLILG